MNKRNTKRLFRKFDFYKPERPITEALMSFGFECGDGWFKIILDLSKEIEIYLEDVGDYENRPFEVIQVKEKFGTLRFYTNWGDKKIYEMITDAENLSASTCEHCGKLGKSRKGSWIKVLCDNCDAKKIDKKPKKLYNFIKRKTKNFFK